MNRDLPTPEQERANAAYVWVKECQSELRDALSGENAAYDGGWAEIEWRFRRLEAAVVAEREATQLAKAAA